MSLFKELLVKEIGSHFRDWKVFLYFASCLVLVTASFVLHQQEYQTRFANHNLLNSVFQKKAERLQYRNVWHFRTMAAEGTWISLKPPPLFVFCRGVETYQTKFGGISFEMRNHNKMPFFRTAKYLNPFRQFFALLDFTAIVTFLLSLLVLVFSFDAISREREEGTLKLALANPVARTTIMLAKLAGGYAVIIIPLLISFLLCLVIAQVAPLFSFSGMDIIAALLIILLGSLYLLVLYCLGLLVSTIFRQSSTAIAVLVLIWLVHIVVVHNITILFTQSMAKCSPVTEYVDALRDKGWQLQKELQQTIHKKYGKPFGQLEEQDKMAVVIQSLGRQEREISKVLDSWMKGLQDEYLVLRLAGMLSPSTIFLTSVSELAGTGIYGQIHHMKDLRRYLSYFRQEVIRQMKIDIEYPDKVGAFGRFSQRQNKVRPIIKEIEPYKAQPMPLADRMDAARWSILFLVCYAVLFFMLAFVAFILIDVT